MSLLSNNVKGFIQFILVLGFVAFSFFASYLLQSQKPTVQEKGDQDRRVFVETKDVTPGEYRIEFQTTGTIKALTEIDVVPQVSGEIVFVDPQFFRGGSFSKGHIVFEIDPRDYELEVERLEAEVARTQTALTLEQAEGEAALIEWKQINGKRSAPDLVARKPQMAEAEANLKAAQAQLKKSKLDLERTKITLPFDGKVLSSIVSEGLFVNSGQSVAQVFNINDLEVQVSLNEQQLKWFLAEDSLDISITASYLGQTKTYKGFVKRGTSQFDTNTRFARVSFGLENAKDLLPGIFTTVKIAGPVFNDVEKLPASAIQKGGVIWLVDGDGRLKSVRPEILYASDEYVVVEGIQDQDKVSVVISRLVGAADGILVSKSTSSSDEQRQIDSLLERKVK